MKIISLQSVGLGDTTLGWNEKVFAKPLYYEVGEGVVKVGYLMSGKEPKVTAIYVVNTSGRNEPHAIPQMYLVYTSDGHVRTLPADKYIAEWGE